MIIDLTTMMFNVNVESGGGTPSWGTALGQGQEHKLNYTFGEEFYAGLIYAAVPDINNVTCPLGKGGTIVKGGEPSDKYSIDLASLFNKIYVNNELLEEASFMVLVAKEYDTAHSGRKTLKYNPKISYKGIYINENCINAIMRKLGINNESAWLVYEINLINQDELHFSVLIVNKEKEMIFANSAERKRFIEDKINVSNNINNELPSIEERFKNYLQENNYGNSNINNIIYSFKSNEAIKIINDGMKGCIKSVFDILDYCTIDKLITYINIYEKNTSERIYSGFLKSGLPYYRDFLRLFISNKEYNKIFYGVPGVGKSYKIKKECDKGDYDQEKTVFHPEYTNADFVGQLLPVRNKNVNTSENNASNDVNNKQSGISYEFVPGPFTRILAKALKNQDDPDKKYMLVIDEINRGNAAAIFGDVFQLLDRDENGKSEFGISNKDIYDYLIEKEGVDKSLLPGEKIYLPSNLYIWATMNTSDQNVYTLDTAFQRRWQMEMLTINFDKDEDTKAQGEIPIPNSKNELTWKEFVSAINGKIIEINKGMISVEDKRVGPWFAKKNEIEDIKLFTQKVIKYLWDDAFKMSRTDVFKDIKTLDDIVDKINNGSTIEDIFDEKIFEKVINDRKESLQNGQEANDENEIEDTNE